VRALLPHLLNKPHELTRAFCVLLKNCLTEADLRERIMNDGAVAKLVKLLQKSEIRDAQRGDAVVAAAAAAVWNLVAYDNAKKMVPHPPNSRYSHACAVYVIARLSWPTLHSPAYVTPLVDA